jgi:DNA-binding transcriptional MerR regulator
MKHNGRLSIGELGRAAGVKVVTIRYYEQVKLMPEPARTEGNYRAYKQDHLHRLQFIRRCRGFALKQVAIFCVSPLKANWNAAELPGSPRGI